MTRRMVGLWGAVFFVGLVPWRGVAGWASGPGAPRGAACVRFAGKAKKRGDPMVKAKTEYRQALDAVEALEKNAERKRERRRTARGLAPASSARYRRGGPAKEEEKEKEKDGGSRRGAGDARARGGAAPPRRPPSRKKPLRIAAGDLEPTTLVGSYASVDELPLDLGLAEVAFIGRSNVGKSSMLNSLVGGKKGVAVVSKTPGRTRRINLFEVRDRKGAGCVLTDLPGYGFAKLSKAEQAEIGAFVSDYLDRRADLRLVVLIVDARRGLDDPALEQDFELLDVLRAEGRRCVVVATKIDKLASADLLVDKLQSLSDRLRLDPSELLFYSAQTHQGRAELWAAISDAIVNTDHLDDGRTVVLDAQGTDFDDDTAAAGLRADFDEDLENSATSKDDDDAEEKDDEDEDDDEIITF